MDEWSLLANKERNKEEFLKIHSQLKSFIKSENKNKKFKFFENVNYSPTQLIKHFERCFLFYEPLENMSWENHGQVWDIEHFIPKCADHFSVDDMNVRIAECFALLNLRPFPSSLNKEKGTFHLNISQNGEWVKRGYWASWEKVGKLTELQAYGAFIYNIRKSKKTKSEAELIWLDTQYYEYFYLNNNKYGTIKTKYKDYKEYSVQKNAKLLSEMKFNLPNHKVLIRKNEELIRKNEELQKKLEEIKKEKLSKSSDPYNYSNNVAQKKNNKRPISRIEEFKKSNNMFSRKKRNK